MKKLLYLNLVTSVIFFTTTTLMADTLNVPNDYSTVVSAVNNANDGDIIEITNGEYTSGIVATISTDNLTIRGKGGVAHLNATGLSISNKKAIFVTTSNNIVLENLEFSGAQVPDENGAGIRHEGGRLTVRNCSFHDNENGILTSNQGSNGELIIQQSEFNHNGLGSAGYTHNIYVGRIGEFVFEASYSHHAEHGHNVKTRAQRNYILYSRIMDEEQGNASYQIDIPNGGLSYIIGCLLHQGNNAENSHMISYAAEGATNDFQEIYVINNSMVNDRPNGKGIRFAGTPKAVITNNIFDGFSQTVVGNVTLGPSNLETDMSGFVDRQGFDYTLSAGSPAIDAGTSPGSGNGFSLNPDKMYVHPHSSTERKVTNVIDIGAYEYTSSTPPPPDPGSRNVTPQNFLLLR